MGSSAREWVVGALGPDCRVSCLSFLPIVELSGGPCWEGFHAAPTSTPAIISLTSSPLSSKRVVLSVTQVRASAPPGLLLPTVTPCYSTRAWLRLQPLLMRSSLLTSPSHMAPDYPFSLPRTVPLHGPERRTDWALGWLLSFAGTSSHSEAATQIYLPSHQTPVICLLKSYSFFTVFLNGTLASTLCPPSCGSPGGHPKNPLWV